MRRDDANAMIDAFLAKGGAITRLPEAQPTTLQDVVAYLNDIGGQVTAPGPDAGQQDKYLYDGHLVDAATLVQIANRHRAKRRAAPFDVKLDEVRVH